MHQQQQEPQFQYSSYATSFHSEFDHFIQSQIASLIVEERARDPNLNREQELGIAIEFCKRFLLDGENGSQQDAEKQQSLPIGDEQQRKAEVLTKLVELKLELEQHKEFLEKSADSAADLVKGHEFTLQPATGKNAYCESCLGTIWRLIQRWRRCQVCGFRVHDKCMDKVRRMCVSMKLASPGFGLLFQLCPEQSLRDQDYQCAECSAPISYDDQSEKQPRLCDYTGSLYCRRCHWNDEMVIPARLVRNWDIEKRPVCRATKQLLTVIARRPLIDLPRENPLLFKFVHTLNKMQRLRSNIMFMKCYFVSCKIARKLRILQHLNRFQYFVESDSLYSMEDLTELAAGRLLPEIDSIVHIFRRHITQECEICRGNAFFCELCSSNERIYPFTDNVAICKSCTAVYHRPCFDQASKRCPRCARRRSRRRALFVQEGDDITE